jgi:hypothetical protein
VKSSFFISLAVVGVLAGCGGQSSSDGSGGVSGSGASSGSGGGSTGGNGTGGGGAVSGGGSGGTSVGGGGGTPGSGGAPCSVLPQVYDEMLVKLRVCNPAVDINQCTQPVPDDLACPCAVTYVNAANSTDLQTLQEIQAAWDNQHCGDTIDCPAVDCAVPMIGECVPDSVGSGMCQDEYE